MAQSGYTPIQLYYSTTAAAVPVNTNLALGELALNTTDEKLYFKNAAGTVKLLASNAATIGVNSLSFGSTGLTPSTATNGVITVAGTLVAANGGTGQYSYTTGDILYASGSTALSKLEGVATGNALISGGVGVAPSYGKISLTTHVSGTLPVANGGTGQTSYTDGQLLIGNSTSNTLTKATLTAGSGVTITNGSGAITIAAAGGGGVKTTSFTMPASGLSRLTADMAGVVIIDNVNGRTAIYLPDATTLTSSSAMFQLKLLPSTTSLAVYTYSGTQIGNVYNALPGYSSNNSTYNSLTSTNFTEQRVMQEFYTFNCVDFSTVKGKWTLGSFNGNAWSRLGFSQYAMTNQSFYQQSCWKQLTPTIYLNVFTGPNPYPGSLGAWLYDPAGESFSIIENPKQIGTAALTGRAMITKLSSTTAWINTDVGDENYIATVNSSTVTLSSNFSSGLGTKVRGGWYISDNTVVIAYRNGAGGASLVVATVSGTSISYGTAIELSNPSNGDAQYSGCSQVAVAVISPTRIVAWVLGSATGSFSSSTCEVRGSSITISGTSLTVNSTVQAFPSGDNNTYPTFDSNYGFNTTDLALDTTNKLIGVTTNNYYYGNYSAIFVSCTYSDENSTLSFNQLQYGLNTTNLSKSWTAASAGATYSIPLSSNILKAYIKAGAYGAQQPTAVSLGFTPGTPYQYGPMLPYFYDSSTLLVPVIEPTNTQLRIYIFKTNSTPGISS